ncbi:uncharacterized protein LOC144716429 [Wolffia australiana]
MWMQERKHGSSQRNLVFHLCGKDGKVAVSAFPNPPAPLCSARGDDAGGKALLFPPRIQEVLLTASIFLRAYNSAFAFTSSDANFDRSLVDNHIHHCLSVANPSKNPRIREFELKSIHEEVLLTASIQEFELRVGEPSVPNLHYDQPTGSKVVVLMPGDRNEGDGRHNIVLQKRGGGMQFVNQLDGNYDPLHFVLLFPYDSLGWSLQLKKISKVTMNQFYAYHFMVRCNQVTLRASLYQGLINQVVADDVVTPVGRMIILPPSFTDGPRYMQGLYQDIFITMTCNAKWPDITEALLPGQKSQDRFDLYCRVFQLKLKDLLHLIIDKEIFGKVKGRVYVVEFQKRGLAHAHMVWILNNSYKPKTPKDIDKIVCAELPDPSDKELFDSVATHMIHGPCGFANPRCPCMKDRKCSKKFPKEFISSTQKMYPIVYALQGHDKNMQFVVYAEGGTIPLDVGHNVSNYSSCYEDLRTVHVVVYDMYQRAAQALGLLHSDVEFNDDLALATCVASPRQVRELFAMMLLYCEISQPDVILEKYIDAMSKDIRFMNGASQIKASHLNAISTETSGIAALLLEGGRTLHSIFKILILVTHISTCGISPDSKIGRQIQSASMIIVDEAPMMHCHVYETLDRSIRDVMKTVDATLESVLFGDKVVVMGGDFRQMLSVILKGSRSMIVSSSLNRSDVWRHCYVSRLQTNVRISPNQQAWSEVLLAIGEGRVGPDVHLSTEIQRVSSLHELIAQVNNMVLDLFLDEVMEYFRFDATPLGEVENESLYPTEFLNMIDDATMSLHKLRLKIGCIVILLRNLNILQDCAIPVSIEASISIQALQFPIRLAFAMTISKSQGQTLNTVGYIYPPHFSLTAKSVQQESCSAMAARTG